MHHLGGMETEITAQAAQTIAKRDTDKRRRISGKLKIALDYMTWGDETGRPLPFDEAARKANLTVRAMRLALERQHVRAYLRQARDVFRASISSRVISRLDELAHQDVNRNAAVASCRAILQLEEEAEGRPQHQQHRAPGFIVWVTSAPPTPQVEGGVVIDVSPARPSADLLDNAQD